MAGAAIVTHGKQENALPDAAQNGIVQVLTAHVLDMRGRGVIDDGAADALLRALDGVKPTIRAPHEFDIAADVATTEELVDSHVPPEVRGAAAFGITRSDIETTAMRMQLRFTTAALITDVCGVRGSLLDLAQAHAVTVMPAYRDHRPIAPTTLAHHLGLAIGPLARVTTRAFTALDAVNRSPFGAGLEAGNPTDQDRQAMAEALGFDDVVTNTLDAVGDVEDVAGVLDAAAAAISVVRRFVNDLLTWIRTDPTSFFVDERWQQYPEPGVPSLMVADKIERLDLGLGQTYRSCRTSAETWRDADFGPLGSRLSVMHRIASVSLSEAIDVLADTRSAIDSAVIVNRAYLANRAGREFTTAADLVPFLITEEALPPQAAREIAVLVLSRLREAQVEANAVTQDMIDSAAMMVIGREVKVEMETLGRYLAPRRFLERRQVEGTPAPERTRAWLAACSAQLERDRSRLASLTERWTAAREALDRAREDALTSTEG